jgi:hypothetical protein
MSGCQATDKNSVTIKGSVVAGVTYTGPFVITPGQQGCPPPKIAQSGTSSDPEYTLTIMADRSGNSGVATDFIEASGGAGHEYAPSAVDMCPSKLNFYFGVNLLLQTNSGQVTVPVFLGQGHEFPDNNWWIGSNAIENPSGSQCVLNVSDTEQYVVGGAYGSYSTFEIKPS